MGAFLTMLSELAAAVLGDRWLGRRTADAEDRVRELTRLRDQLTTPPAGEPAPAEKPAAPPSAAPPLRPEEKLQAATKADKSRRAMTNK